MSPKTSTAVAGTAGNRQLNVTVNPTDATNKNVTYSIYPTMDGLEVSDTGQISWTDKVAALSCTTTITTEDGAFTDTHVLTLTEPESEPESEPEEG